MDGTSGKSDEEKDSISAGSHDTAAAPSGEMERLALLQKLNIAHEVGLDQSFTLKKEDLPENSLEKIVTEVVHSAFWDIFREEISKEPPELTMALNLLGEIKEGLYQVTMPHQERLRREVDETLDLELLRQEAEHGALDVMYFARFILTVMRRLCAPIRDEQIAALTNETDLVTLFRGILDILKLMRLDMANFTLFSIRPEIVSNHMEYERQKFADYIKLSGGSLPITESWLKKHEQPEDDKNLKSVLYEAFLDLLIWGNNEPYPETLILDEKRLLKLKDEFYHITVTASIVLLSFNSIPPGLLSDNSLKESIKEHICLLLEGVQTDSALSEVMENVIEQLKKDINDKLMSRDMSPLTEEQAETLKQQILPVAQGDHRVRLLVKSRILDYLKLTLQHPGSKTNFPPALTLFRKELETLNNTFMSIVLYNINICYDHYKRIFFGGLPPYPSP